MNTDWLLSPQEQAEMGVSPPPDFAVAYELANPITNIKDLAQVVEPKRPRGYCQATMVQQELFDLEQDEYGFQFRQRYFDKLPKQLGDYFAKLYKRRLKAYGSQYASQFFKQEMAKMLPRAQLVIKQYADVFSLYHQPWQDLTFLDEVDTHEVDFIPENETEAQYLARMAKKKHIYAQHLQDIASRLESGKRLFKQSNLQPLCYQRPDQLKRMSETIAFDMSEQQEKFINEKQHIAIDSDSAYSLLLELYRQLAQRCEDYKISPPYARKAKKGRLSIEEIETGLLKLACAKYWLNKLTRCAMQMKEHLAIAVGMVSLHTGGYVSNDRLQAFEAQRKANYEFIKNSILTNLLDDEEQTELLDIWLKSSSNPKKRRIELMTRMNGFDQIAEQNGDEGVFITLTTPSKYHAMLHEGGINPKWNGASPTQTQKYLCGVWAKIRAELNRRGIKTYGFRVAEPHHDATPHWHLILYTCPEYMREMKRVFWHYALEEDGNEKGAKKRRCTFKKIDRTLGSGVAYLAKYISKGIDGYGMDNLKDGETGGDPKLSAIRTQAWASTWRIRQFQQVGGASVGTWRELRRLGNQEQEDEIIDTMRVIADIGDWASYTEYQGGALALRKDLKVRLHYAVYGVDKYQQVRKKVNGVVNQVNREVVVTRNKTWAIQRKPANWEQLKQQKLFRSHAYMEKSIADNDELARPWTCVSNCTSIENNQISSEVRERIKNELIIRRGQVTEYQIDDLLNGKPLKIYSNENLNLYVKYKGGELIDEKIYKSLN